MDFQVKFTTSSSALYAFATPHIEVGTALLTRLREELNKDVIMHDVEGAICERSSHQFWVNVPEDVAFRSKEVFKEKNRVTVIVPPYFLQPLFFLQAKQESSTFFRFAIELNADRLIDFWEDMGFPLDLSDFKLNHENFSYEENRFRIPEKTKGL